MRGHVMVRDACGNLASVTPPGGLWDGQQPSEYETEHFG